MAPRRTLKLKSISCKGLKFFNLFQKPSIYAAVSLTNPSDRDPLQRHETPVDRDCGENPEWDHPIRFTLDRDRQKDLILRFDLTHQGGLLLGDRIVGEVIVPVANLAEAIPGVVRHVSYQVRSPDGKPNGVLSFAYKIRDPEAAISFWAPPPPMPSSYYYPPPPAPVWAPPPPMPSTATDPALYYPAYPPEGGGYYPPPPPPGPVHVGYYPPPVPDSYYPGPQEQLGCRTEFPLGWGRSLTGYI
ncbi:hypothetical protein J5N97_007065 [Dioscorea zingiberensis]|uniref:C2 domain-containing protein n=1 Tax=Dioscorea zingiberensis TaxID=325984 RepID=A0A9D5DBX8_9LILI|nr:hypothetical protein J5N97_007065 [Dioscorea zingiberensis]